MAGVITGKARNVDGLRLSADDRPTMRGIKVTRNNTGLVDPSECVASRKTILRRQEERDRRKRAVAKAEKRRQQWRRRKEARHGRG